MSSTVEQVSPNSEVWDISQSISELAYLTHNFFRYYGKFPSLIGKKIIAEFALPNHLVVDNYVGSGTSLVEAKLAGYNSVGVDINPLAILATRVKCRSYDYDELHSRWEILRAKIEEHQSFLISADGLIPHCSTYSFEESLAVARSVVSDANEKWFVEKTRDDLCILKSCILQMPLDSYREFFTLAFFAIIRRVSKAFDGEIRPHVNKEKKTRPVWKAFIKKVQEMLVRERQWTYAADPNIWGVAQLFDNRQLSELPILQNHKTGLVVSHPPYLNSFDYLPAFSLEFKWTDDFEELWGEHDYLSVKKMEIRAWPATNQAIFDSYFLSQREMLEEAFKVLEPSGKCCVVLGDSTIKGKLIPVLSMVADLGMQVGFELDQTIYRTTHYGVGKYAYSHRADYHDAEHGKKDGVLVLRKR